MPSRRRRLWPLLCLAAAALVVLTAFRRLGPDSPGQLLFPVDSADPRLPNTEFERRAGRYVKAILDPDDTTFDRLECRPLNAKRYGYLRKIEPTSPALKYVFVLSLRQVSHVLPRLLGSVVEAIRFLGPDACVLSAAEEGSTDGTWEILAALEPALQEAGIQYHLHASSLATGPDDLKKPKGSLRNAAVAPADAADVDSQASVIFLDGVAACAEDILELVHARHALDAAMVCGLDWTVEGGSNTAFASPGSARTAHGDVFTDGRAGALLLGSDAEAFAKLEAHRPFQVFSCWAGGAVVAADVVLGKHGIRFRVPSRRQRDCLSETGGENVLFAADVWRAGRGKIAVVPSVNLGYSDEAGKRVKAGKGYVSQWAKGWDGMIGKEDVIWRQEPPEDVACWSDGEVNETRLTLGEL